MHVLRTVAVFKLLFPSLLGAVLLGLTACAGVGESGHPRADALHGAVHSAPGRSIWSPGARMGVHGMVVFGVPGAKVFMSHIPMFHSPHDVQMVMEVSFPTAMADLSGGLYTFLPERFSLDDVILGERTSFKGTLYEGNFESGGRPVETAATVTVSRVIHASALGADADHAFAPRYLLIGSEEQSYLVHGIQGAPAFDQILRVSLRQAHPPVAMESWVVARGLEDSVEKRLRPGSVAIVRSEAEAGSASVHVEKELSVLVGPDFVSPPSPD